MKKLAIEVSVILIVFFTIFAIDAHGRAYYGFENVQTYQDLMKYTKDMQASVNEMNHEDLQEHVDKQMEHLRQTSLFGEASVFVVTVTDGASIAEGVLIQNAIVNRVVEGDVSLHGKEIQILRSGGLIMDDGINDESYLFILGKLNLMKPGDQYLVFCEETEISYALEHPLYRVTNSLFSLLCISRDDDAAIAPEDIMYLEDANGNPYPVAPYAQYADQEFFAASEDTLQVFVSEKRKILKKYGL